MQFMAQYNTLFCSYCIWVFISLTKLEKRKIFEPVKFTTKYFNSRLKLDPEPKRDFEILISRINIKNFFKWLHLN